MVRRGLLPMLFWIVVLPAAGQDSTTVPFALPTPPGWRTETIAFPPSFAPTLRHQGLEELRFSPGMFDPDSADFWSYLMLWWLPGDSDLGTDAIEADLRTYFTGLVAAVAPSNDFDPAAQPTRAELERAGTGDAPRWQGRIETLDAFATGKAVTLRVRISAVPCGEAGQLALIFAMSPQPAGHRVWTDLTTLRDGFRCPA